jgi:hypothetical protein
MRHQVSRRELAIRERETQIMAETSNARRARRRLGYFLAPLVLAGSIAIGTATTGVAQAAPSAPARVAVSAPAAPAQAATSGPAQASFGAPAQVATGGTAMKKAGFFGCRKLPPFFWTSVLFKKGGSVFYSHPGCKILGVWFIGRTGWYQGYERSWRTHWHWRACGKPVKLWKGFGFAILCKCVPFKAQLRVVSLQDKFVRVGVIV